MLLSNRLHLSEVVNVEGSPVSNQSWSYDAANRISSGGFSYDAAGQMLSDGSLTYTWDRAGRLKTVTDAGDTYQYAYNGLGQRVQQTVNSVITDYLLDTQPALPRILATTTGRHHPLCPQPLGW
ncbi:MAG: RHS repeat protein [Anaerolineales bacterium]|nr:RHS repeat protein [Anaerolineales bacterium]